MTPMKSFEKFKSLKLGAITAEGFLKEQLLRNKDGMGGNLDVLEPGKFIDPYTKKTMDNSWSRDKVGWFAEVAGNYWYGLIGLAFTLNDKELIKKADKWVHDVLSMQDSDGYMGIYTKDDDIYEDFNGFGTACGMRAMLSYYEATGKEYVYEAVNRCMLWFCEKWANRKTRYVGVAILEPMLYCYNKNNDDRILKFVLDYEKFLCENDLFLNSVDAYNTDKLYYNSNHTCAYGIALRQHAMVYGATGDENYLNASIKGVDKAMDKIIQHTGAPVCNAEYLAPISSTAESEYCSFTFFNATYAAVAKITGKAIYGDYMEKLVYNAGQGSRKKDEKAIIYMTSPNQIYATDQSSNSWLEHQLYAPCHSVSCCAVSSVGLIPDFIRNMVFGVDGFDDLYINAYGPCVINHNSISIKEETLYPFRDTVNFTIDLNEDKTFVLNLKIPIWCENFTIYINDEKFIGIKDVNSFVAINRKWCNNDVVKLKLEMIPKLIRVNDNDSGKKHPMVVEYGALVFAFPIPEKWNKIDKGKELPEDWSWYSVIPYSKVTGGDQYELMGYNKHQISWNIAVDELKAPHTFQLIEEDVQGYVWENPPVKIKMEGYKAPFSYPPYPIKTQEVYEEVMDVTEKLDLTLIPYGCTALRITYIPRAKI